MIDALNYGREVKVIPTTNKNIKAVLDTRLDKLQLKLINGRFQKPSKVGQGLCATGGPCYPYRFATTTVLYLSGEFLINLNFNS